MPRSKRNKQIELAKTKKRGLEWKKRLFEEVRSCVDKYENVFIFSVNDMRNNKMKTVREQWKHSRFFIGKNKIMAMALGRFAEEEYRPNLHKLGQQIKGQRGLLFSNKPIEEVLSWFRSYSEGDYARSGNTATETVNLQAGPLTMFPHNLEPYLRELGLPTTLEKGVIHLIKDHEVCKVGDVLSPESAKILKLLGFEMAEFHVTIDCVWSKDGTFMQLTESIDMDTKENKKHKKKSSISSEVIKQDNVSEDEQMEIEQNAEESSDDDDKEESKEVENHIPDTVPDVVESALKSICTTNTSTPKAKSNDVTESGASNLNEESNRTLEYNMEEISEKGTDKNDIEEIDNKILIQEVSESEVSQKTSNVHDTEVVSQKTSNVQETEEVSQKTSDVQETEEVSQKSSDVQETEEVSEKTIDMHNTEETLEEKNDNAPKKSEENNQISKRGKPRVSAKTPRVTKKESVLKRESLAKTPDANTSQDSPIFRELRNRSVKVNRKKKRI